MTTRHAPFDFIAGDDWQIIATLFDQNNNPYDLTGAEIKWTLTDAQGHRVLDDGDFVVLIIDALAGQCSIVVTADTTTILPAGKYNDALRIVSNGVTSTLAAGPIMVSGDPWLVAPAAPLKVVEPTAVRPVGRAAPRQSVQ